MALWLFAQFDMSLSAASVFFFWTALATASSFPVAAWLSRHIGLINTMVFTHIPANICLILAAFAPTLPVALGLLLIRAALAQMDVPARSSYVMAVVTPAERAAAASFTSVPRSIANAASPALGGALFAGAVPRLAADHLRRAQDRLRPRAAVPVPAREAAGGTLTQRCASDAATLPEWSEGAVLSYDYERVTEPRIGTQTIDFSLEFTL